MVVTLHVAWRMPSPLEIYFSAQQLHFAAEYRELCAATESKILDLMIDILSLIISS
jgi:hypothetical protein